MGGNIGLLVVGGIFVVGVVIVGAIALVTDAWRKVRQAEHDTALKRDMLQRGMPADEIVRVLQAGSAVNPLFAAAILSPADLHQKMLATMLEHSMSGEDIARVLPVIPAKDASLSMLETLLEHEMTADDIIQIFMASQTLQEAQPPVQQSVASIASTSFKT